jgi:hypothetical protein
MMIDKFLPPPFKRSYWVIPGKLLAGVYPGSSDPGVMDKMLQQLVATGVTGIVNLMEPDEIDHQGRPFARYQERFLELTALAGRKGSVRRFPVADLNVPTVKTMKKILDEIDHNLERDRPVYLHCWGGRGRTGTVVGCYLKRRNPALDNALLEIVNLRSRQGLMDPSPETAAQKRFVMAWPQGK